MIHTDSPSDPQENDQVYQVFGVFHKAMDSFPEGFPAPDRPRQLRLQLRFLSQRKESFDALTAVIAPVADVVPENAGDAWRTMDDLVGDW